MINGVKKEHYPLFFEYLSSFVLEERITGMKKVLDQRTRKLTLAIEDIYQPQNASAVLRSCDCFGIQDVHIIENRNTYTLNPGVALGASKWLTMHKYSDQEHNTDQCIKNLKKLGYKIAATTPHTDDTEIQDLDLSEPVALIFGNERKGVSDIVRNHADVFVKIPMFGFTESFNISVSASLCLYECSRRLRTDFSDWQLSNDEKEEILINWMQDQLGSKELYLENFRKRTLNV